MLWTIEFEARATREIERLDPVTRTRVLAYLRIRLAKHPSPNTLGEPLHGEFAGLWRWRVGDYRILGRVVASKFVVVVVSAGHRSDVYR